MGVVNIGNNGSLVDVNGGAISNFLGTAYGNPAMNSDFGSKLGYILAIVAGALFLLGAFLALLNLIRDKYGVHLLIILFALERVATYVLRAITYKKSNHTYIEIFEILEAAGTAIILITLYHLWAGTARSYKEKASKRGRLGHCCTLLPATIAAIAGAGLFIAGAVLQDRASATPKQADRGYKLRKAAVVVYGALLLVFDIICLFLFCRRGGRRGGLGLLLAGLLLSAKAGFQIYAIWHRVDRYYQNKFFWPLMVLTELLALLIIVMPGFVRTAFRRPDPALPVTDQYVAGDRAQPYAPSYASPAIQPTYK